MKKMEKNAGPSLEVEIDLSRRKKEGLRIFLPEKGNKKHDEIPVTCITTPQLADDVVRRDIKDRKNRGEILRDV